MPAQTTLARPVTYAGVGLHSGVRCAVTLYPSEPGTGLRLQAGGVEIPVHPDYLVASERCTALGRGPARVLTVEHLLAALTAMGVDNARIEVVGPEIPGGDGSARRFCEMISRAGVRRLGERRPVRRLPEPIWVSREESLVLALPGTGRRVTVVVDFGDQLVGRQYGTFRVTPERFREELAPARTFVFEKDIDSLRAAGLGAGATTRNVLVIGESRYRSRPRFVDEVVRHKAVDLIGDLALAGGLPEGHVIAVRSGHRLHQEFARRLAALA